MRATIRLRLPAKEGLIFSKGKFVPGLNPDVTSGKNWCAERGGSGRMKVGEDE